MEFSDLMRDEEDEVIFVTPHVQPIFEVQDSDASQLNYHDHDDHDDPDKSPESCQDADDKEQEMPEDAPLASLASKAPALLRLIVATYLQ